ncbi:domain of Kin17 curved DNA-binding protein-domain-containing protein [Geopyxis carbonaria]|nr:domain of Kin17 curved DNA-binding protein-domain-containing protein [Geopyxis carbonaria]
MPRAEVGSTKHLANKMKSKGLQRLRWYCQVCERQMRDENGFKCHTQSESHVRQMLIVGEDPRKAITNYSNQFRRDFLTLLRTSHGEKKIDANRFYQEYIGNKEHIHMNATRWVTLSEFIKQLGREGVCRVEDDPERGLMVAWIDSSPDALRRQEAVRKKERMDRGDELREQRLIREQVERAQREAEEAGRLKDTGAQELQREEGEKVKLSFSAPKKEDGEKKSASPPAEKDAATKADSPKEDSPKEDGAAPASTSMSMKIEAKKPKNVFSSMGKKDKSKDKSVSVNKRPMSEAERIMKEEIEKRQMAKHRPPPSSGGYAKRQRVV